MKKRFLLVVLSVAALTSVYALPKNIDPNKSSPSTVEKSSTAIQAKTGFDRPGLLATRKIDDKKVAYFVSPSGNDASDGKTRATAFATMQKAVDVVQPGETVLVLKGVYPSGFHIHKEGRANAWISIIGEPGVEIRGSDVEKHWTLADPEKKLYNVPLPKLQGSQTPETPFQSRLEQVFVDGQLLSQVPEKEMLKPKGVFYADGAAKLLWVCLKDGVDPNTRATEVTRRSWAIQVGAPPNRNFWQESATSEASKSAYIRIEGFRVRNIANFSRQAAISVRGLCHDIVIENCDVQWVNSIGFEASTVRGWSRAENQWIICPVENVTIRHCIASNCGVQGIGGGGPNHFLVESNIMDDNNYKDVSPYSEGGACKTGFEGTDIVMRNNVARNNNNHGLWVDNGGAGCVFENNFVFNSVPGAILDEATPLRLPIRQADGKRQEGKEPTAEEVKAHKRRGTIIRNNVVVGTRGRGISISASSDAQVYNNILSRNDGSAISMGSSVPTRTDSEGCHRNRVWSNICFENFYNAELNRDEDDPSGLTFDNTFENNLFVKPRGSQPFNVGGLPSSREDFDRANHHAKNFYSDAALFANPEKFDFTLADAALAASAGFDPKSIRLDWSAFYIQPKQSEKHQRDLAYFPIDLSAAFNRSLADEVPGDGKGGWTDQGKNDMSLLPNGKQIFDGVEYLVGPKENGAVMLPSSHVKTETPLPRTVSMPVHAAFDNLFFLYTASYVSDEEKINGRKVKIPNPVVAQFIVRYSDGTSETIQTIAGLHIVDWWGDPSWQQQAALNDNGAYSAWQGPNRAVARVTVFYRQWNNPHPEKEIESITVSNENCPVDCPFALLGITGARQKARPKTAVKGDAAFVMSYNGDMDAIGSDGEPIEPVTAKTIVYSGGRFEAGINGKAYRPKKVVAYPVPADFPLQGEGTLSLWLRADDWTAPERVKRYKSAAYTRTMTPFSAESSKTKWSVWDVSFRIDEKDDRTLLMSFVISGIGADKIDVTQWVKADQWFNVTIVWQPSPQLPGSTQVAAYLDGQKIADKTAHGIPDVIGQLIYPGIAKNGGTPWVGLIGNIHVLKKALSTNEIAEELKDPKAKP